MALAVARTIEDGGALVVEAGTGVGKTFSYLVPALLSGERVLLSTATKTLQDQLFGRDLPRLVEALGLPVRTALLKGRGSYLCLHRLDLARHDASLPERGSVRTLAKIEQWSKATRTGDLAELPGLDERSPLIPLVTSTRDNCLGAQCPQFKPCHVNLARREAMAADVVVINHHLFFADLAVRESGMAELLPTVRVVVFDEAHQLNETGVQFLGVQLGTGQVLDFARDMLAAGLQHGARAGRLAAAGGRRRARRARPAAGASASSGPAPSCAGPGEAPEGVRRARPGSRRCDDAAARLRRRPREALDTVSELSPDFVRLHERARSWPSAPSASPALRSGSVRWVDVGHAVAAGRVAAGHRRGRAHARAARPAQPTEDGAAAAWVFTSATLGDDAEAALVHRALRPGRRRGAAGAEPVRLRAPGRRCTCRATCRSPTTRRTARRSRGWPREAPRALGGRTLVLTTTLRALRTIGDALRRRFERWTRARLEVLVQGELPKRRADGSLPRRRDATGGRAACWWRRLRSGKASMCRAMRCSWW